MSCMFRTKLCVPGGVLVHVMAGESPSPVATPGAACVYFTGIWPPSLNPATVIVIGGGAAGAPPPPRCWAFSDTTVAQAVISRTAICIVRMLFLSRVSIDVARSSHIARHGRRAGGGLQAPGLTCRAGLVPSSGDRLDGTRGAHDTTLRSAARRPAFRR